MTLWPLLLLLLSSTDSTPPGTPGIRITTRYSSKDLVTEQTVYINRDRRRTEYRNANGGPPKADGSSNMSYGPPLVSITRCDLGQAFELNLDDREYLAALYPPRALTKEEREKRGLTASVSYLSDKPTIKVEITTLDTNERKEIFGRTARHIITTTKETPLEGSRSQPRETISDGWFIDLDTSISCDPQYSSNGRTYHFLAAGGTPIERRAIIVHGARETGYPIQLKITTRTTTVLPDGTPKEFVSENEKVVTELEEKTLDRALFEVPVSFRKVSAIKRSPPIPMPSSRWAKFKNWFNGIF